MSLRDLISRTYLATQSSQGADSEPAQPRKEGAARSKPNAGSPSPAAPKGEGD